MREQERVGGKRLGDRCGAEESEALELESLQDRGGSEKDWGISVNVKMYNKDL